MTAGHPIRIEGDLFSSFEATGSEVFPYLVFRIQEGVGRVSFGYKVQRSQMKSRPIKSEWLGQLYLMTATLLSSVASLTLMRSCAPISSVGGRERWVEEEGAGEC